MESFLKIWSHHLFIIVPILCILVSVVLCECAQQKDIEAIKQELLKGYEEATRKLQTKVEAHSETARKLQTKVEDLQQQLAKATEMADSVKRERRHADVSSGGAVYVHWGRQNCSSTTEVVYTGIAGGGSHAHTGAAVNMLCMTHNPVWGRYGNDANYYTYIYGTEYEVLSGDFPLGHERAPALHNHDVPCTVCRSATRTSAIMIPGTTVCESGWQKEYSGYLMAGYHGHVAATEYNCIDANPETHEGGAADENGRLLFRVKAKCGALPCDPYVDMREVTCVVCTK